MLLQGLVHNCGKRIGLDWWFQEMSKGRPPEPLDFFIWTVEVFVWLNLVQFWLLCWRVFLGLVICRSCMFFLLLFWWIFELKVLIFNLVYKLLRFGFGFLFIKVGCKSLEWTIKFEPLQGAKEFDFLPICRYCFPWAGVGLRGFCLQFRFTKSFNL